MLKNLRLDSFKQMKKSPEIISLHKKNTELKKRNKLYLLIINLLSDSDYDKLKRELINLETEYTYLKKNNTVSKIVGAKPSSKFKKIKHLSPMLSLSNAFDESDMKDFLKKINNYLNYNFDKNVELFCEPKIDGVSASLIYEKGILTKGLSRGDGLIGEDILENLQTITSIPRIIKSKAFR